MVDQLEYFIDDVMSEVHHLVEMSWVDVIDLFDTVAIDSLVLDRYEDGRGDVYGTVEAVLDYIERKGLENA